MAETPPPSDEQDPFSGKKGGGETLDLVEIK